MRGDVGLETEEDVRRLLEQRLRGPVDARVWNLLVEDRYVQEVIDGEEGAFPQLMARYRKLLELASPAGRQEPRPREIPPDHRLEALALVLAAEAAAYTPPAHKEPVVPAFRREVLGGRLLSLEGVAAWIEHAAAAEAGEGRAMVLHLYLDQVPADRAQRWQYIRGELARRAQESEKQAERRGIGWAVEMLAYPQRAENGDWWTAFVLISSRTSTLGRLKQVADILGRYGWSEAEAVAFVLTGIPPRIPKGRAAAGRRWPAPTRITLDVDPRLSRAEVAALYSQVRQQVFPGRDKPMTEKMLRLAVFWAGYPRRPGNPDLPEGTWRACMTAWNREHTDRPEWHYEDYRWFSRDARAALGRVTRPVW